MDLSTIANVATALTVIAAVIFGLLEARRARQDRQERAAFTAIQAIMTPAWMNSVVLVQSLPDDATAADIESNPTLLAAAQNVGIILEAIGYSVFARIVPLKIVDDLVGGTVRVAWGKLGRYVEFERQRAGSQKSWEWFEWLAQQLERHSQSPTTLTKGAPQVYRDWKP
jgi:hypothetical protein